MLDSIKRVTRKVYNRLYLAASTLLNGQHYDNADTSDENRKHWQYAADTVPSLINTPDIRRKLRARAQYEADNNCYCGGLVSTMAIDTVGYTFPTLRIIDDDDEVKNIIESEWKKWIEHRHVNLPHKITLLERTRIIEGEGFLYMFGDDEVATKTGFNLNVDVLGAGRICDPYDWTYGVFYKEKYNDANVCIGKIPHYNDDGVIVNLKTGRPVSFKVSTPEQEILYQGLIGSNPVEIDARYMLQWFIPKRAGQFRGISELTPTLNLYGQLRRYDLAILTAAETAASFAALLKTTSPALEPASVPTWSKFELERGMAMALPEGWEPYQMKPEYPIQAYENFVNLVLRQIGRALNVPFGIVAGDSSKYNYSSARLDYSDYDERKRHDQLQLNIRTLNPVYSEWLLELARLDPRIGRVYEQRGIYHTWVYNKRPSSDPTKDASAEDIRLKNGSINLSEVYANRGKDVWEELEQRKKEFEKIKKLGLTSVVQSDTVISDSSSVPTSDSNEDQTDEEVGLNQTTNARTDEKPLDSNKQTVVKTPTENVQSTALNGAQITSLLLVTDKVALKQYPADAAKGIIRASFPAIPEKLVTDIITSLDQFESEVPVTPQSSSTFNQSVSNEV